MHIEQSDNATHTFKLGRSMRMKYGFITTKLTPMQYYSVLYKNPDPIGYGFSNYKEKGVYH